MSVGGGGHHRWVLEMWAYTCAAWVVGIRHDLVPKLQAQPPWDQRCAPWKPCAMDAALDRSTYSSTMLGTEP